MTKAAFENKKDAAMNSATMPIGFVKHWSKITWAQYQKKCGKGGGTGKKRSYKNCGVKKYRSKKTKRCRLYKKYRK